MTFFAFLSWFRPWWKTAETDYETVLQRLTRDISQVQARLVRVRQRERRVSVTLTIYAVVAWIGYAAFVWMITAKQRAHMAKHEKLRLWAPVGIGLLVILSLRYVVGWWYQRVAAGEEKHLRSLQSTRRKKIDEIKAATRYDHLRNLLERYDDTAPKRPGGKQMSRAMSGGPSGQAAPSTPKGHAQNRQSMPAQMPQQGRPALASAAEIEPRSANEMQAVRGGNLQRMQRGNDASATRPLAQQTLPNQSQAHVEKTLLDRVADKILGVDTGAQIGGSEQRYALICQVCFNHNGLCHKEDWDEVQYICPRCGTFNSRRPSSQPTSLAWNLSPLQRNTGESRGHSPSEGTPAMSLSDRHTANELHGTLAAEYESRPQSPAMSRSSIESRRHEAADAQRESGEHAHAADEMLPAKKGEKEGQSTGRVSMDKENSSVRRRIVEGGDDEARNAMQVD